MQGRKATTYIVNTIIYVSLFVLVSFIAKESLPIVAPSIIFAILLNTGLFIGGNSLDKITNLKNKIQKINDNIIN